MEIFEEVHRVDGVSENVYLINGEEIMLIDTGMPGNSEKILDYLDYLGKDPEDLSKIILTHYHIDHVGNAHKLKEKTGAEVMIHEDDGKVLSGDSPPVPPIIFRFFSRFLSSFYRSLPIEPTEVVNDGDKVGSLEVVHTPGHTPGSISLYDSGRKIMFVGDTLRFNGKEIRKPPWLSCSDTNQLRKSIENITRFNFEYMLSGHGRPLKIGASEKIKRFSKS